MDSFGNNAGRGLYPAGPGAPDFIFRKTTPCVKDNVLVYRPDEGCSHDAAARGRTGTPFGVHPFVDQVSPRHRPVLGSDIRHIRHVRSVFVEALLRWGGKSVLFD